MKPAVKLALHPVGVLPHSVRTNSLCANLHCTVPGADRVCLEVRSQHFNAADLRETSAYLLELAKALEASQQ